MSDLLLFEAALVQRARDPIPESLYAIKAWLAANRHRISGMADVHPADGYVAYLKHRPKGPNFDLEQSGIAIPVETLESMLTPFGEPKAIIAEWIQRGYVLTDTRALDLPGQTEATDMYRIRLSALLGMRTAHLGTSL